MMRYQTFDQINVRLRGEQKEWLYKEADIQMSNVSVLVRQAVKLFIEKVESEREETNKRGLK